MKKVLFSSLALLSLVKSLHAQVNIAAFVATAIASNTSGSIVLLSPATAGQTPISNYKIDSTSASALRFSGSAATTGYLANSNDGTLLFFTGANTATTAGNINTFTARGVGSLNSTGTLSLAATYTGISGNQTRAATSLNNTDLFIADQAGLYTNGSTAPSPAGNLRAAKSFGGTAYISTASATATIIQVNTVSATTGSTLSPLPGLTNNASLQDFYLIKSGSSGAAYDVLYVLSATTNTAGSITKYSLVGGTWVANGSYTTTFGGFGIAAQAGTGTATLFVSTGLGALSGNSVLAISDAAGYNAAISITTANNINLYTTPTGSTIKGIALAPQTNPLFIRLEDFAAANEGASNIIHWVTGHEDEGDNADLMRAGDNREFKVIASFKSTGHNSAYSYTDAQPLAGMNYYQLRMNDAAGGISYSKTVTAIAQKSEGGTSMIISPNPVRNNTLRILLSKPATGLYELVMYGSNGQIVMHSFQALSGEQAITATLPALLAGGSYFISVSNGVEKFEAKAELDE